MKSGVALVLLLVFMAIAITITTAATMLTISSSQSSSRQDISYQALSVAESGMENALMRLIRDPSYSGETLTVDTGVATITVNNVGSVFTVNSTGTFGQYSRSVQVTMLDNGGIMSLSTWREIYP
jgi:type II secretory pathway component PulK